MLYCRGCFDFTLGKTSEGRVCASCLDELSEYELRGHRAAVFSHAGEITDVLSLWRYRGLVRDLIIRAKVKSDMPALSLLSSLVLDRDETRAILEWADVIVPAPSSLWGRLRGRLDIAGILAADLARRSKTPLQYAPIELLWRWRKNAMRARKSRIAADPVERLALTVIGTIRKLPKCERLGVRTYAPRILLVDDVVTSGGTLQRAAKAMAGSGGHIIRCLTIARS